MNFRKTIQHTSGLIEKLACLNIEPFPETPILFAKIKLLWQCNLSCVFCDRPRPNEPMPEEFVSTVLQALCDRGLVKIHFSGGEVFLHPQIFSILKNACSLGLQVNLTTNGTLLDREKIHMLSEIGVHSISISLDAATPSLHDKLRSEKGAFKKTMKTIHLLNQNSKKRPKLRINTVVTALNLCELDDLHALIDDMDGLASWKIMLVDTDKKKLALDKNAGLELSEKITAWEIISNEDMDIKNITRNPGMITKGKYGAAYYRHNRCYMPWLQIFVDPYGFVYPCCMSRGQIAAMGNLHQHSLDDILTGKMMREIQMNMASFHPMAICYHCDDFFEENKTIDRLIKECTENENSQ